MAKFRQFSTHRPLRATAFKRGSFVDFPAEFPGGIMFKMVGPVTITGSATGDAVGELIYQWGTHDLDVAGTYAAAFIGTDGSGKTETIPTETNSEIVVIPAL